MNPEMTKRQNETQAKIDALTEEFEKMERTQTESYDSLSRRIESMWLKVGLLSGAVSVILAKLFGSNVAGIFSGLI